MVDFPAGTVTFLFTDIEGSTRLLRSLGDDYPALLEQHHSLLRESIEAYGGHVFGSEGDAFFIAFKLRVDTIDAAPIGRARRQLGAGTSTQNMRGRCQASTTAPAAAPSAGIHPSPQVSVHR